MIAANPGLHTSRRQRGAIMIVALIFLVVMTTLILASMRGTVMQERMAANLYDRSLAFQAAEAALRAGELLVVTSPPKPTATGCDSNGNCGKPDPKEDPVWKDEANWENAHSPDINIGDLPVPPQFLIELLADGMAEDNTCASTSIDPDAPCYSGPEGLRYRITARSGEAGRAVVILQSIYAVPKPAGW